LAPCQQFTITALLGPNKASAPLLSTRIGEEDESKMKTLAALLLPALFGAGAFGQQKTPVKPLPLPDNMDCERLKDGTEISASSAATVLRRGSVYYACRPKTDALLTGLPSTATVATVVRSTQTISCGDGSGSDCLREDFSTELKVKKLVDDADLWRYFDEGPPSHADLVLQFVANEQAGTSPQVTLRVQDSNTGAWVYYESRPVTDLENDINRLISHFVARCARAPIRSAVEMARKRRCADAAAQLSALRIKYEEKRKSYDFKSSHLLDAQMEECELHWKDFVCLGHDERMYASNWNDSGKELKRKMDLEYEELKKMEQQISLAQSACP
jgi:hypothetical protein